VRSEKLKTLQSVVYIAKVKASNIFSCGLQCSIVSAVARPSSMSRTTLCYKLTVSTSTVAACSTSSFWMESNLLISYKVVVSRHW